MHLFKKLVYGKTYQEFQNYEQEMRDVFKKYENYQKYVNNLILRKNEWSLLFRINQRLPTSNQNTTNICETSLRREKEEGFNRYRAYNLTDMVRMIVDSSEGYAMRCVDAANGSLNQRLKNCLVLQNKARSARGCRGLVRAHFFFKLIFTSTRFATLLPSLRGGGG